MYIVQRGSRYTAMIRDSSGRRKSAGTYDSEERAREVGEQHEAWSKHQRGKDPASLATMTLSDYAPAWLRAHQVSPSCKNDYLSALSKHILPVLGAERVAEVSREQIRHFLADLQEAGVSPVTIRRQRIVLSAMLSTAVSDGYRVGNPAHGLKTPRIGQKSITVLTVDQFESLYRAMPNDACRTLLRTVVSTGLRFGEVTALTLSDIDVERRVIRVSKAVSTVGKKWSDTGSRFLTKPYPKNGHARELTVDQATLSDILAYAGDMPETGLLFPASRVLPVRGEFPEAKNRPALTPEFVATLPTFVGANGRTYQHGTVNGYSSGGCRATDEPYCAQAVSEYTARRRANRRGDKKPHNGTRSVNITGHIAPEQWRKVFNQAVKDAGLPFTPTSYQMRHTHASWLIAAGVDPKVVMTRLGHGDLSVTNRYVQKLKSDQIAADAMESLLNFG